jgi:hypothetical protein
MMTVVKDCNDLTQSSSFRKTEKDKTRHWLIYPNCRNRLGQCGTRGVRGDRGVMTSTFGGQRLCIDMKIQINLARSPYTLSQSPVCLVYRSFTTSNSKYAVPPPEVRTLAALTSEEDHSAASKWLSTFTVEDIPKTAYEVSYSRSSGPGGQVRLHYSIPPHSADDHAARKHNQLKSNTTLSPQTRTGHLATSLPHPPSFQNCKIPTISRS